MSARFSHSAATPVRRGAAWWRALPKRVKLMGLSVAGGGAIVVVAGGAALALWSDNLASPATAMNIGGVQFSAQPVAGSTASLLSTGETASPNPHRSLGTSVTVTMPGATFTDDYPSTKEGQPGGATWEFEVTGYASGIAGLDYTVSFPDYSNDSATPTSFAQASTMVVYPASGTGADATCSNPPTAAAYANTVASQVASATGDANGNYTTVTLNPQTLQQAGFYNDQGVGTSTTQIWCVHVEYRGKSPEDHTNVAVASGSAANGTTVTSSGEFETQITFPTFTLELGGHTNIASVEGQAANGTEARAQYQWDAKVMQDMTEPNIPITITPVVTNVNPDYKPPAS